jgi:hypothetical protein
LEDKAMRGKPRLTFMTEAEARPGPDDLAFRERRLGKFLISMLFLALVVGFSLGAWMAAERGGAGAALAAFLALMVVALIIMFMIAFASFQAAGRPTNWLLRVTAQGLFIHYRSYLNSHLSADRPTVLFLPHREIAWMRASQRTERRKLPNDTATTQRRRYLEIGLRKDDVSELEEQFADERAVMTAARSRFNHYPVLLVGRVIRVEWRSPRTAVAPGLRRTLDLLGPNYPAAPDVAEVLASDETLTDVAAQEARIRDYLAQGDTITATKLARHYFDYDLTAAKAYVERMEEKS